MGDFLRSLESASGPSVWGFVLILGYPVLVLGAVEASRALGQRDRPMLSGIFGQIAYLLLPAGAIWLILRVLVELPPTDRLVRTAETVFALSGLYLLLRIAQAALMAMIDSDDQGRAPKLLFDMLRIGLALVWGAVTVSNIWDIDLGSLFAAMGVGSIVLGFALQEFLGNLLSGLGLLSAHKFGIGDWIMVDGAPACVIEMDWRTVTLSRGGSDRLVVANSTLAKGNLVITARASEPTSVKIPLAFGLDIPPERIREAVMEAGADMPGVPGAKRIKCVVTGVGDGCIKYQASLPVPDPAAMPGVRDEFLSRFWYVAQRRGVRLDVATPPDAASPTDADARTRMLAAAGAFRLNGDVLARFGRSSVFRQYRRSDVLLLAGAPMRDAFLVLSGALAVALPKGDTEVRLDLVGPGQLLVLHETLAAGASPIRVTADQDSDVLAIPATSLIEAIETDAVVARDVHALAEARRLAVQTLKRPIRGTVKLYQAS